ncbi:mitochondrial import inner membrane translocase subunit TIM50-like isoform X1 [Tripterygium wilfordii]|uniref:Mitochondrial import inner membrane translocase subunit TIM50 n=1 Tax=Tripterygium wilfordii TaxID=458696 RepID=A0A7J7C1A3_TRIWF|nr:mitochondrial import inner membrane translocase subunit TIM50-like [Tripterygium wilfordii]KAF5727914.1 mitochondrial import inner membrane translocase subunit TIM50-like isoform X1 [Tripterygium wilfordii]
MSSSLISRRVISAIISNSGKKCNNRRFLCSGVFSSPPKESISSSQTVLSDSPPPPLAPEVSPSAASSSKWGKAWTILKTGIITTLTGATAAAGYATYAYTLDELDEKTKRLREPANQTLGDDASAIDKFQTLLSSTAKTVPAKAIEFYLDLRRALEEQVRGYTEPTSEKLLPDLHPAEQHVFTLVLDLNETLLYSDWKRERGWRTFKRPGVEAFLEHMAKFYEIVVYSDQLNMYVDPVLERLDKNHCIRYRLSRAATKYVDGTHYRDLSKLNRDPRKIIYVSGHALESSLQPENCVPIKPYKLEGDDTALLDLIPFLEYVARSSPPDIRKVLESYQGKDISKEFIERSKDYQRRMQEQRQQGRLWRR